MLVQTSQLLGASPRKEQDILPSRRTSEAWTHVSWLIVGADGSFCPPQACLGSVPCCRPPPPTEGQALCQEMWRPAFLCHPGFQDPTSKMSLSGLHGNFTTITQTSTQALCFTSIFAPHSVLSRQCVTQETRDVTQAQT